MDEIKPKKVLAKDIMTKKVLSVSKDTSIFDVAKIISEHNFDGLPVTDKDGLLLGIITEYDLIIRTSTANSSFLQKILGEVYSKKSKNMGEAIEEGAREISSLTAESIMNKEPLILGEDTTFEEIVAAFIAHHRVNPIPIVNSEGKVVGIISRFDILRPLNLLGYGNPRTQGAEQSSYDRNRAKPSSGRMTAQKNKFYS